MTNKVQIEIPKADEKEVVVIPTGEMGKIHKRFEKIDQILFSIMITIVLAMIAIIVSLVGVFLDQMRYNNAAYKEYSAKTQEMDSLKKSNNELFQQNKQNQELILQQQKQILELLNKSSKN